jgi:signal transduction histidine kinase/ligand-binding sensor domain-containing protein/DNA-binding NarL/FixJ family response regulator
MQAESHYSLSFALIGIHHALALLFRRIFICLLFLIPVSTGFSQYGINSGNLAGSHNFKRFTVNEGLSQNLISSIYQDHLGYLWVGTKDGLNMFDGYEFRVFKYNPSAEYSLTDNHITAIYEDVHKRLWIGTLNEGLHYYDRLTLRFIRFYHDPDNENSISGNHIQSIVGDKDGNLWVGTIGHGLNKIVFNGNSAIAGNDNIRVFRYDNHLNGFPGPEARIQTLLIDRNDQLWIGTGRGVFTLDTSLNDASFISIGNDSDDDAVSAGMLPISRQGSRVIFEDGDGVIWMGNRSGLFIFDTERRLFTRYNPRGNPVPVIDVATATFFNNQGTGEIWIASQNSIHVLNPVTGKYTEIPNENNLYSGSQGGRIISIYADSGGSLWLGSDGRGLSLFSPGLIKFSYALDIIPDGAGIISSRELSIHSFYENPVDNNTLWIGAKEGLYKVSRNTSLMERVRFSDPYPQENTEIFSIAADEKGFLWIGSGIGLIRFDPADNSYKVFPVSLSKPGESIEPRINKVHVSNGNVWVLTPNTIALLDQETWNFEHTRYNNEPLNRHTDPVFPDIHEDIKGNFWIASKNGLHYFDVEKRDITTYLRKIAGSNSHHVNDIKTILADHTEPGRYLWLGTAGSGITRFDTESISYENYSEADGLSNNMVYGMLYDDAGSIWISTNRGLSKFSLETKVFTNYSSTDGLQSNEFNSGAFYKSPRGEMFFGGINGYNRFFPSDIKPRELNAPVVFTSFRVLNDNLPREFISITGNNNDGLQINLPYNKNDFTIDFAALDFANPVNNSFSFSMSTSVENWIYAGNNRSITFTDMSPGIYTFRVRGTNSDGLWSDREAIMTIKIASPWWNQTWIYFIYVFLIMALITGVRKYELSRIRLRDSIKLANIETVKLRELDQLKSQFFANISHEFRTPLTLIKGPLEQLSEAETDTSKKNSLRMILSNASRLLQLINQLLDLSKTGSNNYNVIAGRGDFPGFIRGLTVSFASLADQKSISLRIEESPGLKAALLRDNFYYDPDIVEKIISNLLSNALKFTPKNGSVTLKLIMDSKSGIGEWLELLVSDTGIGIPEDKLTYIYDRFYQVSGDSRKEYDGTGIGLAYVKELVRIHKASIHVTSELGMGTTFSLRFPMGKDHFTPDQIVQTLPGELADGNTSGKQLKIKYTNDPARSFNDENNKTPWVLIVEDHAGVGEYIAENIRKNYRVKLASNAHDGVSIAQAMIPDLIISDVMMPGMDGYEFCNLIKSNDTTSHIPVILLTARASDSDRMTGLETGADDYMAKPFNVSELRIRIKNLIDSRRTLREKFKSNSIIKPEEISVTPRDAVFIEKLLKVVTDNISNNLFSVEDLGRETGMSHSQIHRKLKATINISAIQFIRSVRMHKAMELLTKDALNIAETAYLVGYDDPGYFTKSFRAFFGKLPSEINRKYS